MALGAYLEAPPATAWPCYKPGYPGWCGYYRVQANWQAYSDVLSEVIVSWNQIQKDWAGALVPDVIVDDMSPGFTLSGNASRAPKGGWRGHFVHAPASATATHTGTWTATLKAGTWRVSAFIPYSNAATAPDMTMTIEASDGPHAVPFDESKKGGK